MSMKNTFQTSNSQSLEFLPKIGLLTMFRLGLFQMGLGIMSLLTLGVINRVMIDELKVIPWVAAVAIAMYQFVSPAKVWFGQMSDSRPIRGYHRTIYIWFGAIFFTSLSYVALQVAWELGQSIQDNGWGWTSDIWAILLGLVFAFYGLALSMSSTPFAALLVDVSDDDNRSQLIGIVWSMLMVGIVIGAIISSQLLNTPEVCGPALMAYDPTQSSKVVNIDILRSIVNPVFIIMPIIVFGLCLIGTWGVESSYSRFSVRSNHSKREDQITLKESLKVLTSSRQTFVFFSFILILTLSLFMQDTVMEPYGGEVFGMCISETTKLNAFFGIGTLLGIGSTGFLMLPKLGKKQTTKIGCIFSIVCFTLIIAAGIIRDENLLKFGLLVLGLASGIITAGATSLMLDLTVAETAGTFIGAWGLSQAMARGFSTVLGGVVLHIGKSIFSVPVFSYSLVFLMQGIGMLFAINILKHVSIKEFKNDAKSAISVVMEGEIEG